MSITSERKYSAKLIKLMGREAYEKAHARAAAEPKSERDARWAEYQKKQDRGDELI